MNRYRNPPKYRGWEKRRWNGKIRCIFEPLHSVLCTQYYDLDKPDAPDDAFAFYLQYANRIEGKILEPMCGSGRFLIPIMELGYDIEGFDASQFMLEALYIKCKNKKIKPKVAPA